MKKRTDTKKDANKIKSDNFTRSNKKIMIGWQHNFLLSLHILFDKSR